jgi:hypothetical protein
VGTEKREGWPKATLNRALEGGADGSTEGSADRVSVETEKSEGMHKSTLVGASEESAGNGSAEGSDDGARVTKLCKEELKQNKTRITKAQIPFVLW